MKKTTFAFSLIILFLLAAPVFGYVLLPAPQEIPFQGGSVNVTVERITLSSRFKTMDPRVLRSLQQVFPNAKVSDKPAPNASGGMLVYAANTADDFVKKNCAALQCASINPKKIPAQGYFLGIRKIKDSVLVLILFSSDQGAFYATKTLKQIFENNTLPEISINDWPDMEARGILEGFYGKPWPANSRTAIIPWLADYKFNGYLYAPKDDHKLRFGWRVSFTDGEMKRFKEIADLSNENFIQFCWELSPGMSINFSSRKDLVKAYQKYKDVITLGIDCIVLAFDDVGYALSPEDNGKFASYWEAQMEFTNKLLGKLLEEYPHIKVAFVPNDYWGNLVTESDYLRYVGEHLDPRAQFGWTGTKIIPQTVTPADARIYEYYIKRKPFLGDNYPVTDNVNLGGRLSLGPLRGRDPRMFRYISGFAANAMPLAEASKPAFLTIADYCWNPFAYDGDTSWKNAVQILGGKTGADALAFFSKQSESSFIWKYDAVDLFEATRGMLKAMSKAPHYDFNEYAKKSETLFTRFSLIDNEMESIRNPANSAMLDEMQPWILKLKAYGGLGLRALDLLKTKFAGAAVDPKAVDLLEADWNKAEEQKAVMTKDVMLNFMLRALAALRDQPTPEWQNFKTIMTDE